MYPWQHLQGLQKARMVGKIVEIVQNCTLFHQYHHVNQPLCIQTLWYSILHLLTSQKQKTEYTNLIWFNSFGKLKKERKMSNFSWKYQKIKLKLLFLKFWWSKLIILWLIQSLATSRLSVQNLSPDDMPDHSKSLFCWWGSYLTPFTVKGLKDRKQRVVLNGQNSAWANVKAGVPQGSTLGPLLFLIYINDLPDKPSTNVKLFADNTSLFSVFHNIVTSSWDLKYNLNRVREWAFQWKMSFNP